MPKGTVPAFNTLATERRLLLEWQAWQKALSFTEEVAVAASAVVWKHVVEKEVEGNWVEVEGVSCGQTVTYIGGGLRHLRLGPRAGPLATSVSSRG
jgi:hypothetical protein